MNMRNLALLGVVLFLLIALVTVMTSSSGTSGAQDMSYSQFLREVDQGRIKEATIKGDKVTATLDSKKIAVDISKRAYEVVPYVSFAQWVNPVAYREDKISGVIPVPSVPAMWNIEKK